MGSFTLTQAAKADLKPIGIHTQRRLGKAQRIVDTKQFDDAVHMLAKNRETGGNCDFVKPGYRKFPNGSPVIFYRSRGENEIRIVRILHKRMDVARQLIGT